MYRKSWPYYRDSTLMWLSFFAILGAGAYALQHPAYWAVTILLWMIRSPFRYAFIFAHPFRRVDWIGDTRLELRDVTFSGRDGSTLFGRFRAGRNQSTVILLHELGGTSADMLLYADRLAAAGYGIFMIDLRAHGSSDGDTSTFGLREADDVACAVEFLLHRADVNGSKIGALGVSLGAQAALRGALKTEDLRALVLDGLGPATLSDHGGRPDSVVRWFNYPFNWLYYRMFEFMIGGRDAAVLEVIGKIAPRPILLIASGAKDIHFGRLFLAAANEPKEIWEIPDGTHADAMLHDPRAYTERVVGFFDRALS